MTPWTDRNLVIATLSLDVEQSAVRIELHRDQQAIFEDTVRLTDLPTWDAPTGHSSMTAAEMLQAALTGLPWKTLVHGHDTVWLKFDTPVGSLPALPWDRAIARLLSIEGLPVPVFRLPRQTVRPAADIEHLAVVLCVDAAGWMSPDDVVSTVRDLWHGWWSQSEDPSIEIFTDTDAAECLRQAPDLYETSNHPGAIRVYGAESMPTNDQDGHPSSDPGEPSWLSWVADVHRGQKADILLIMGAAMMQQHHASLLMRPTLSSRSDERRLVTAGDVETLALQLGAWSIGIVGLDGELGHYLIAHQLSTACGGPVVTAPNHRALGQIYVDVLGGRPSASPALDGATTYAHPDGATWALAPLTTADQRGAAERTTTLRAVLAENTLASGHTLELLKEPTAPAWLASNQRLLEQWVAPLLDTPPSEEIPLARRNGIQAGLQFLSQTLMRAAATGSSEAG